MNLIHVWKKHICSCIPTHIKEEYIDWLNLLRYCHVNPWVALLLSIQLVLQKNIFLHKKIRLLHLRRELPPALYLLAYASSETRRRFSIKQLRRIVFSHIINGLLCTRTSSLYHAQEDLLHILTSLTCVCALHYIQ